MSEDKKDQSEIAVVRAGEAPKANGSKVGYEIGHERATGRILLRVVANDGGGTFSKEFVPMDAIRRAVEDAGGRKTPFRGGEACQNAYKGKSRNNGPFLAYALRGEGLLEKASEKDSLVLMAGDWDGWEKAARSIPLPDPPKPPPAVEAPAPAKAPKKKSASKPKVEKGEKVDSGDTPATDAPTTDDPAPAPAEVAG